MSGGRMSGNTADEYRTEDLFVDDIKVDKRSRNVDPVNVSRLCESMAQIGLLEPITVRETEGGDIFLVSGEHRLEAAKRLGWEKIPCRIAPINCSIARLWEIAENLHRVELTALEKSELTAEWIRLTEEQQERLVGVANSQVAQIEPIESSRKDGRSPPKQGGIRAAARQLGIDRNEAQRAMKRVENIAPEIRDEIREMPTIADKGVELDALAKATPEQQSAAIAAVKAGEADSVRQALATPKFAPLAPSPSPSASNVPEPEPELPLPRTPLEAQPPKKRVTRSALESDTLPIEVRGDTDPKPPPAPRPDLELEQPLPCESLSFPVNPEGKTSATATPAVTDENYAYDRNTQDYSLPARSIELEPLKQKWDDRYLAMAVSWLLEAACCAPDAPQGGTCNPAAAAELTIAELVSWAQRLERGRTKELN